jgi:Transposase DDE domain
MYNESLIRRGEILLDFDVIDNWDFELEKMNQGKEGRKFVYPDSFIKLLGYMRAYFHLPYRQTEGIVRELMLQIHCHHQFQIIVTFVEE